MTRPTGPALLLALALPMAGCTEAPDLAPLARLAREVEERVVVWSVHGPLSPPGVKSVYTTQFSLPS